MSSICPVLRRFPATRQCLEDSNIPLSVTVTPLIPDPQDANTTASSTVVVHPPNSLTGIPKCWHCGAPHACPSTHFRSAAGNILVCYLCGTSGPLPPPPPPDDAVNDTLQESTKTAPSAAASASASTAATGQTHQFSLPLRLPQANGSSSSSSSNNNSNATGSSLYSVPAMSCPVLWLICLDGSCDNAMYWNTVSETLQHCLQTAPPHVHVALFIASQQTTVVGTTIAGQSSQQQSEYLEQQLQPCSLGIFDLSSPVPHIRHYSSHNGDGEQDQIVILAAVLAAAVPADTPHIATAIRSLMDYHPPSSTSSSLLQNRPHYERNRRRSSAATSNAYHSQQSQPMDRCPVAWMTELVLAALAYGAVPAGHRGLNAATSPTLPVAATMGGSSRFSIENDALTQMDLLPYAGVTLTFVLANRPAGISSIANDWPRSTTNMGITSMPGYRFGGNSSGAGSAVNGTSDSAMAKPMDDVEFGASSGAGLAALSTKLNSRAGLSSSEVATETELTPHRLLERYQPVDKIEAYYADLGRQCADAAVGVDIILLVTKESSSLSSISSSIGLDDEDDNFVPDFGLALIQPLSERSGADVPLLVDLTDSLSSATVGETSSVTESPMAQLHRSVLSRTPWQEGRVFGAELRLRASPGIAVDPTVIAAVPGVSGPQLAPLYYEAGLVGPASSVGAESAQLWRMGTAFPHTAFTMDLELTQPKIPDRCHVDGVGDIPIQPVIQTCFAYTTIVAETDEVTGAVSYHTVRRMRIASRPVPLAHSVEALYASLDTEALAVVLFHKIALASVQDGLVEAADMAVQWLQLLLSCVYRSALDQLEVDRRNAESGVVPNKNDAIHRYFYPGERLLHLEGELSADDVLLAQGHDRLRPIPLMVYLLLQSDPLRLSEGGQYYRPSFDERIVTLAQMTSMTPSTLTRCIAPRLQLWESGAGITEPIFEVLDLRSEAVQSAILEASSLTSKKGAPGLILLLDTPDQIVIMDARYVNSDFASSNGHGGGGGGGTSPRKSGKAPPLIIGEGLQQAINDAASSYRTRPRIVYELDQSETSGERTLLRLLDCLLEDTPNIALGCEHFAEWKANVASAVQSDVDNLSPR